MIDGTLGYGNGQPTGILSESLASAANLPDDPVKSECTIGNESKLQELDREQVKNTGDD